MADESATQSQARGCSSYPFSFPSQPPDIKNWFSSYQYESPEVPELAVHPPAVDNGSETQDPLEFPVAGHSFLKDAPGNGGTDLKRDCFGSQAEHAEASATRDFLPIGGSTVEQGTKRKQSLRGLFGFLDDHEEGTQTENRVASPVQRSAVDPPWNRNWVGLQNRKRSHEGMVEHSELPTDSESTCIAETQTESRVVLPVLRSAMDRPWDCNWIGLRNRKRIHEGVVEHSELPMDSESTCVAETQTDSRVVLPALRSAVDPLCDCNWIGLRNRKRSHEGVDEHSELPMDSEGTCVAETQLNPPGGQETKHSKGSVNCGGTSLAADNEEGLPEDGTESNLPVNFHSKGLADAEKTKQSLRGLFEADFLDNRDEATQTESRVASSVLRSAVDPRWDCNWIGLRNRKRSHEGAVEYSELVTDSEGTCIAETQVNPPGGQQTNPSKHPVNCGGTSLEDGIEHSNLPVNFPSKGLAGSEKTKRSLRKLFGAGFLNGCDEANESETRVVSAVQRNAVQPLSNCNAAGLPHIEHIHEGAVGYSELLADHEVIGIAETRENPQAGRVIEHNRLPVNCGRMSLLADTEDGFLEAIEHSKPPVNSHSQVVADTEITGIKHHMLPANSNGIGSAVTEESFPRDEISRSKRKLEHKKTEETAAADGFVAIRTKVKSAENCRTNKISKVSTGRENTTLQENRCISGTTPLGQGSTRSPMSDRTNISEVAGAPSLEISGKWKHPRKGKPNVGPPMIQLRLEQWVRRV
ncbi:unnamed protein product [Triticum turgidum subsp. durum]|uniref:Uncharacterized protein n=1 Tax=Triticum turgidum subsp. durum TaxID=4567 RepID=A0A9R1P434_TRITD|nr:unnamed protein product [Triticum turgidum subsp. durum]